MKLSIAIPVHNDAADLARLLRKLVELDCANYVVVVDDGSDIPLDKTALCAASGFPPDRFTLVRHDSALGPGVARNRALRDVPTSHVMFLDADDQPTRELPNLLADLTGEVLSGRSFDFCLFQHHDSRSEQERRWGQMPWDHRFWQQAGLALGALSDVTGAARPVLAQTANYPWNKIYRTDFLRANDIKCSALLVHEDVELHWRSFLGADTILASDRIAVIHDVVIEGTRLTNRAGPERLDAFAPLTALADAVHNTPYAAAFTHFALGLIIWISDNLDTAHHAALANRTRTFLEHPLIGSFLEPLTEDDPALIMRIKTLTSL